MKSGQPHLWWALLAVQLPAVAPVSKYASCDLRPFVVIFLGLACALVAWLWRRRSEAVDAFLERRSPVLGLLIFFTVITAAVYPEADGLKTLGLGSDADDAVIQGVTRLFQGLSPYATVTYSGHPLSPGPGWLILWSPLVLVDLFWLAGPLSLGALAWALQRSTGTWRATNGALLLLASSLVTWEGLVTGSDYLMIGALIGALTLELHRARTTTQIAVLAIVLGLVATSRVVFLYVPIAAAAALWPHSRRVSVQVAWIGTGVALLNHGIFYLSDPANYSPLHVMGMGRDYTSLWVRWLGVASCLTTGVWILGHLRRGRSDASACLLRLWPTLAVPLGVIALGGLELVGWRIADWWTVRALVIAAPVVVATWALASFPPQSTDPERA